MQPHRLLVRVDEETFCLTWVNPLWDTETLLAKEGIFFLEDLCDKLPLRPEHIQKDAFALEKKGKCPWQTIGVKRIWGRWLWLVQMAVFAAYFQTKVARSRQGPIGSRFGPYSRKKKKWS